MDNEPLICPSCGQPATRGKRYCGDCGAPLPAVCPACGGLNPPGKRFCADCGRPLTAEPAAPAGASITAAPAEAPPRSPAARRVRMRPSSPQTPASVDLATERHVVTIVFADLVNSTAFGEALDPEDVRDLVVHAHAALARTVARYGGHVAQYLGDGVLALFGAPVAREDDAERAVLAGLEMHRAVAAINEAQPERPALYLRVGIATGEVVAGTLGNLYGVSGDAPNTAARIQAAATVGAVLVDAPTMRLARRRIRFGQERRDSREHG